MATFPWNGWQLWRGLGGNLRLEYAVQRALFRSALFGGPILLLLGTLLIRRILKHDEHLRKQRSRRDSDKQLRSVLRHAPCPLAIVRTSDGVILYTNLRAREDAKVPALRSKESRASDFFANINDWDYLLREIKNESFVRDHEVQMQDYQRHLFLALMSVQTIHFNGEHCVLITFANIHERRQNEELLQFKASHDALTGLPNRAMFDEQFTQALAQAERHQRGVGLFFIDLDGFKEVNDSYGHDDVGDVLLKELATRLRLGLRKGDIVGRFGGDEFVVLITEFNGCGQLAAIARQIIDTIAQPLVEGAHECRVRVTASIGIAISPQNGEDTKTLLQNADSAMYRAKEQGKNGFIFHTSI